MTILVTGGAGYIGSQMVLELIDAGESAVVVDDLSTGARQAAPESIPLAIGDVGDRDLVRDVIRTHGVTEIIHFAASISVAESMRDPLRYYRNNTANTEALLEVAVQEGVRRLIFSSTCAVYGNSEHSSTAELTPLKPLSAYGRSKDMSETILRDVSRAHGLKYVTLRYFNVAGADPQLRTGQRTESSTLLIKVAVEAALGLRPYVEVFGTDYATADGTCIRDYIHVADLARVHLSALRHLRQGGDSDTFNCGYGRGYSVFDVIGAVKRVSGRDFDVRVAARRPGDPATIVADSSRIRSILDWTPQFQDLDTIVRHALEWERHFRSLPQGR